MRSTITAFMTWALGERQHLISLLLGDSRFDGGRSKITFLINFTVSGAVLSRNSNRRGTCLGAGPAAGAARPRPAQTTKTLHKARAA